MNIYGEAEESRLKRIRKNTREGSFTYELSEDEPKLPREIFYALRMASHHSLVGHDSEHRKFLKKLRKCESFSSLLKLIQSGSGEELHEQEYSHLVAQAPWVLKRFDNRPLSALELIQLASSEKHILLSYEPTRLDNEPIKKRFYIGKIIQVSAQGDKVRLALNDGSLKSVTNHEVKDFEAERITGILAFQSTHLSHHRFIRIEIIRDHERGIATVNYRSTMREPDSMTEDLRQGNPPKIPHKKKGSAKLDNDTSERQIALHEQTLKLINSSLNKSVKLHCKNDTYVFTPREYLLKRESAEVIIYGDHLVTSPLPLGAIEITERNIMDATHRE